MTTYLTPTSEHPFPKGQEVAVGGAEHNRGIIMAKKKEKEEAGKKQWEDLQRVA